MNGSPRLRMKDLCARTGLNRQAIHFYVREGLLAPGDKTSRNMAWYDESHVERILLVRKLQHERFLPLQAIKALLDQRDESFDEGQRAFLHELRLRLSVDRDEAAVAADDLVEAGRIAAQDLERLEAAGVSGIGRDAQGRLRITGEALPIVEILGQLRALGFTEAQGFQAQDVLVYERLVTELLRQEARILARGMAGTPPDEGAARIIRALPLVHELLARLHRTRILAYLDTF